MLPISAHTKDNRLDLLFSTAYLPPVSYLVDMFHAKSICIDQHEHFVKQSFMNRCQIFGPNGMQLLIIPVNHKDLYTLPIRDVRISNETRWHKTHWKSICTAYRNSPYFEFYEEDFSLMYETPSEYLFEFNLILSELLLKLFKVDKKIIMTDEYKKTYNEKNDFRNIHHPRKNNCEIKPYRQIFSEKHGFLNNLSSIDLLFNVNVKEYFSDGDISQR